ncbi:MAG: metal ABC transporter permease [Candidatus Omnitrophota bacterium]|jgi:zinc transport system permease protein|nr:metal ABC transporter permease [Candidatus Omnitrophota bacterium]MDD5526806.1 metal ABC transporter permease [Candidatus Omnitrophota bacterium]
MPIDFWYKLVNTLPFEWAHYVFMENALLAVLLVTPLFALMGTMVVSNRMVFFTDVLGHSALTGIAIGVLLGFQDPVLPMLLLAVLLSVGVNLLKNMTRASMDTVLGVLFAFIVALGIVILSRRGGFAKYTGYLIGDILTVTPAQIGWLLAIAAAVMVYWLAAGNAMIFTSISSSLARSRKVNTFWVETSFTLLLALVVILSIRLAGILIINSLLVLPAAAARNISRNMRAYTAWAVLISLFSGISGLIVSFYWGTASGATIVLFAAACYSVSALFGAGRNR